MNDLRLRRFGKLVAISPTINYTDDGEPMWLCNCDCGKQIEVRSDSLLMQDITSCGCKRNIKVCKEWDNSYEAFEEWSFSNGYTEDSVLERIDKNKDYSPKNCRWVKEKENI